MRFETRYAASLGRQLQVVVGRQWTSYMRNVGLGETRIRRLLGLQVLFGTVYYKIAVRDSGGVSSLVAARD